MDKINREISKADISNWFLMNIYIIIIPPIAKAIITLIIGYGVDIKAIFTDYSLMVFAIIFNIVSLIYEKTRELLLDDNEKKELEVQNKWLYLGAALCGGMYLFSVTYGIVASIIFGFFVTGISVYCVKIAKNIWNIIKKYSERADPITQEDNKQITEIAKNIWNIIKKYSEKTDSITQEDNGQIIEEAVNEPPEKCQKE